MTKTKGKVYKCIWAQVLELNRLANPSIIAHGISHAYLYKHKHSVGYAGN